MSKKKLTMGNQQNRNKNYIDLKVRTIDKY